MFKVQIKSKHRKVNIEEAKDLYSVKTPETMKAKKKVFTKTNALNRIKYYVKNSC